MAYLNSDDGFPEHPKVDALTDGAYRLHDAGRHYCAKNLSDGRLPARNVRRLVPNYRPSQLTELLDGGLWHHGGEGCNTDHSPKGEPGEYVVQGDAQDRLFFSRGGRAIAGRLEGRTVWGFAPL